MSEPPDEATAPARAGTDGDPAVLLSMDAGQDRRLLAEALEGDYRVSAEDDPDLLAAEFDCCVLDRGTFDAAVDRIEARREGEDGFLPVVLLVEGRHVDRLPDAVWNTVDEVIDTPVPRAVLRARIANLVERRHASLALHERNEQLDAFASVVSHDLRNPLFVAEGRLALAREAADNEDLAAVADAHARIRELIEDLLALARGGRSVEATERVDLAGLVEACWATVDTAAADLRGPESLSVEADPSRLRQLLENLFRNAVEHGGEDVTITVGELDDGFYVEDDGPGIPDADRERVLETGVTSTPWGTGLGLAIVAEIAEGHGWDVAVTEAASGGARFEFTGVRRPD